MHRAKALMLLAALMAGPLPEGRGTNKKPQFSGEYALEWTRKLAALGPRPVDSDAHRKMQQMIIAHVKASGCAVEEDAFVAQTPLGPKPMKNIIAKVRGTSGRLIVISGHYDTKLMPGTYFVGANDGGASAGFLMEMARLLCGKPSKPDVYLVWFDGEESTRLEWSDEDSLYGSRRMAARWDRDGTLRRLLALINVDMIGDKDLRILNDMNSNEAVRRLIWATASELGYAQHFDVNPSGATDDHIPFVKFGAPAVDLIDFDYGLANSYWHTDRDTVDKLSARSFQVVGDVVLKVIEKLGN